ncbi:MAG: tetratricopeptide repeat protein [Chitinophagales bacterium]|nr:tetratricopeptide repeat protein [Chitinophagales bacterium]
MKTDNRDTLKNELLSSWSSSEFDNEAKEGWDMIGFEKWDVIHKTLDEKIDKITDKEQNLSVVKKRGFSRSLIVGMAAVVLLLLGISTRFLWSEDPNVKLFNQYYKALSAPEDVFRGDQSSSQIPLKAKQASEAYDELDYKKSVEFYTELLKENPNNAKYTLFLGLSYLNQGRYDDAILLFNDYTPQGVQYDEDIQWYLALAHLRKGEIQTSRLLLQTIYQNRESYYANTAKELATRLDKLK